MGSFVQLNVGGVLHTTTRDTLLREPASRLALVARGVLPCPTSADGALFIDRSPKWFQTVLNYLRDGWVGLPKTPEERRELLQEIRYYQLTGFEAWLRAQEIASGSPATAAGSSDRAASPAGATAGSPLSSSSPGLASAFAAYGAGGPSLSITGSGGLYGSPGAAAAPASLLGVPARPSVWEGAPALSAGAGGYNDHSALPGRPSSAFAVLSPVHSAGPGALAAPPLRGPSSYYSPQVARVSASSMPLGRASSASAVLPEPPGAAAKFVPQPLDANSFRWTRKYLQTNDKMRAVVGTLLELAFLPPHRALHAGKVSITIASECNHDRVTAMLGAAPGSASASARDRLQVVSVKGAAGWAFEMALRPGCDPELLEKYSFSEFVQDNWFVLAAILKDEYGVIAEDDTSSRPTCAACRRANVSFTLEKVL